MWCFKWTVGTVFTGVVEWLAHHLRISVSGLLLNTVINVLSLARVKDNFRIKMLM